MKESIKKPEIRRLMIACGCDGVTKEVYNLFRGLMKLALGNLLGRVILHTLHARRKTIFLSDLRHVQESTNFRPPPRTCDEVLNTLEKVAKYGDGYFFSRAAFTRLVREVVADHLDDRYMLSQSFLDELQYHIEFVMRLVATIAARGMRAFTPVPKSGVRKSRLIHPDHLMFAWRIHLSGGLVEDPTSEAQAFAKSAIKQRRKRGKGKVKAAKAARPAASAAKPKARKAVVEEEVTSKKGSRR